MLMNEAFTDEAIQLELRPFDDVFHDHHSVYRGEPRPELDRAWMNLLKGSLQGTAHMFSMT